jgi:hypothetical protein
MNDDPSNSRAGTFTGGLVVLLVICSALRLLVALSKEQPPPPLPPESSKIAQSIMKSITEADDADFRSHHGVVKAAVRTKSVLQKWPDANYAVKSFTISLDDGKLTAHMVRTFPSEPADKQDKVMEQVVRVWRASPYVRKHGFSAAVCFVGPNNWKREFPAPPSLGKPPNSASQQKAS